MSKDLRTLKKDYEKLSATEIFQLMRNYRNKSDMKTKPKLSADFANLILNILNTFSKRGDINSERVLLNQLIELSWGAGDSSELLSLLEKAIFQILIDSQKIREKARIELFQDYLEILIRFPKNKSIYDAISRAILELVKWGTDTEILDILDLMKEKAVVYPFVESIQLLDAKVYMNALFYLDNQECNVIKKLYSDFSCFSLSCFDDGKSRNDYTIGDHTLGDDVNEILQEGVINAIINLARVNSKFEKNCEECIKAIREIIIDSNYLLRKDEQHFFKDVYRLSYTLEIYNLWDEFLDLPIIQDLKKEKEKNQAYEMAEAKLLAIQKNMRIEEYDALKIGRRGIKLAYNYNEPEDLEKLTFNLIDCYKKKCGIINLVEEIDAIIDTDEEIKEHLRETGQIPSDKQTVDELQDITSKEDDLTQFVTKEKTVSEQLNYLKSLELGEDRFLTNQVQYTKALIFSSGMYGFNSEVLAINPIEVITQVTDMANKKMIRELIEPLVRAVTLRAARLDGEATSILLDILNNKGMKFITRYYKQYNFVENIIRLISYLGRTSKFVLMEQMISELEEVNTICLQEDIIPYKIARAINEGLLVYNPEMNDTSQEKLLYNLRDLANRNSYDILLQVKLAEGLAFTIFYLGFNNWKQAEVYLNELILFSRSYQKNAQINEKAALGILWGMIFAYFNNQKNKALAYQTEIIDLSINFSNNDYIQKIKELSEKVSI